MNVRYGKVNTNINLRGHRFSAGTYIRIWKAGETTSIQPIALPTQYHSALWYMMPKMHLRHIDDLDASECAAVDFGFFD
jgi:hypothetical protein